MKKTDFSGLVCQLVVYCKLPNSAESLIYLRVVRVTVHQGAIYSKLLVDAHLYLILLGGHLDDMRGYQLDLHTFTCPGDVARAWVGAKRNHTNFLEDYQRYVD